MCLLGIGKNELRFLAMPAASELVFIGPVGSSRGPINPGQRRSKLCSHDTSRGLHGAVRVGRVVVRTTDMVVVQSAGGTYLQR